MFVEQIAFRLQARRSCDLKTGLGLICVGFGEFANPQAITRYRELFCERIFRPAVDVEHLLGFQHIEIRLGSIEQ